MPTQRLTNNTKSKKGGESRPFLLFFVKYWDIIKKVGLSLFAERGFSMKKKFLVVFQILSIFLAAALLLSVVALVRSGSEKATLEEQVQTLRAEVEELQARNQELNAQLNSWGIQSGEYGEIKPEFDYSSLEIDSWSENSGMLTVSGYIHVGMFSDKLSSARLELWKGDVVLQSLPLQLQESEAEDVYEKELADISFQIPDLSSNEELQLWLVMESASGNIVFTFGAGWYQEDGHLLLITG